MEKFYGVGKKLQIGPEASFGTLATMEDQLNYLSESLKLVVSKEAEESLLAEKTVNALNVKGYSVEGDVKVNAKPENLRSIFKYAFYEAAAPTEVTTGVYKHTLVLLPQGQAQKSASIIVDRGAAVKAYLGLILTALKFEGQAKEQIGVTLSFKGKGVEQDGSLLGTLDDPSLSTFNALNGTISFAGVTITDVTNASLEIDEGADEGEATYGSGLYNNQALHGLKVVKLSVDAYYNAQSETIRESFFKQDAYVAVVLAWQSAAEIETGYPFKIQFTMPKVAVSPMDPAVSGKDVIKLTIEGQATGNGGSEPLTVEVWDDIATVY